MKPEAASAMGP